MLGSGAVACVALNGTAEPPAPRAAGSQEGRLGPGAPTPVLGKAEPHVQVETPRGGSHGSRGAGSRSCGSKEAGNIYENQPLAV